MQLEDEEGQRLADEFNSPKANRDEAKGSEEKPVGTPRALHPQPPAQEITQETQVTADSPAAAASIVPAGHLGTQLAVQSAAAEAPSDSQRALAPAVMEIVEASSSKKGPTQRKMILVERNEQFLHLPLQHLMLEPRPCSRSLMTSS